MVSGGTRGGTLREGRIKLAGGGQNLYSRGVIMTLRRNARETQRTFERGYPLYRQIQCETTGTAIETFCFVSHAGNIMGSACAFPAHRPWDIFAVDSGCEAKNGIFRHGES